VIAIDGDQSRHIGQPDDRFDLASGFDRAIALATKHSAGSSLICAAAHDRIRPEGGVRIEAYDRPAMAETGTAPGQNADCRSHEASGV
jgi:hypothetical protein